MVWSHYPSALTPIQPLPPSAPSTRASSLFLKQTRQAPTSGPWHTGCSLFQYCSSLLFSPNQRQLIFQVSAQAWLRAPRLQQECPLYVLNYPPDSDTHPTLHGLIVICMTLDSRQSPPTSRNFLSNSPAHTASENVC